MIERQISRGAVEAAAIALSIEESIDTVTSETVMIAYRKTLRGAHPDSTVTEVVDAANQLHVARTAKGLLLEWIELRPDPDCSVCRGSGFIRGVGFTSRKCPRCNP